MHLDMFWTFHPDGRSILDAKLRERAIDTVIICGLWTDECITATAFAAFSRGYDVVVVRDAVASGTPHHESALTVINASCGKVLPTSEVVDYMLSAYVEGGVGAVKGVCHPDGRKDAVAPPWDEGSSE